MVVVNISFMAFDVNSFGIIYSLFRGRQNIFLTTIKTNFVVNYLAKFVDQLLISKIFLNMDLAWESHFSKKKKSCLNSYQNARNQYYDWLLTSSQNCFSLKPLVVVFVGRVVGVLESQSVRTDFVEWVMASHNRQI